MVIPAYEEARRLPRTLERILSHLAGRGDAFEVLVVDDGSRDDTSKVAASFAGRGVRVLGLERNRGKGAAVRRGVLESQGERVLLCDADLATPIEELEALEPYLMRAPLVFGSRAVEGSRIEARQPFYREGLGRTFNLIIRLLGVRGLRDTQCGFKLIDGSVARSLFRELTVEGFAFDVELVWLARRAGHAIEEVGVRWNHVQRSRVRLLLDPAKMLWDVLRFRARHTLSRSRRRGAGAPVGGEHP